MKCGTNFLWYCKRKDNMTSPYNFDSSDDYYDSLLEPWKLKLLEDMENGDIDPEIYENIIWDRFDEICDYIDEKYFDVLEDVYKELYEVEQEPINMKSEMMEKEVCVADDGSIFYDEYSCELYERRLSVYNALHNNLGVYNWIKENYSSIVDIIENNWTP